MGINDHKEGVISLIIKIVFGIIAIVVLGLIAYKMIGSIHNTLGLINLQKFLRDLIVVYLAKVFKVLN